MIGFGIIGTGSIAGHHIKSIQDLQGGQVIGIAGSSPERSKAAEKTFGVKGYPSYRALIEDPAVDAVCICTYSGNHLEPTLIAAAAGKHVLVEKPLEVSLERADQMITACREAGIQLGCIFQNRFSPDYVRLKELVKAGDLGKLYLGNAYIKWYRAPEYYSGSSWKGTLAGDGGAALINQSIHTIDLLLDIMGPVDNLFAKTRTVRHQIEGEDLGVALLEFKNGALGTIEGSTAIHPGFPERLEVYGEKGSVVLEGGKIVTWEVDGATATATDPIQEGNSASDPMAFGHQMHRAQIADFIAAIQENRPPIIDGIEGRKSLEVIKGIYRSSEQKKTVFF